MRCIGLRLFQDSLKHKVAQDSLDFARDDFEEYKRSGVLPGYVVEFLRFLKEQSKQSSLPHSS